MNFGTSDGTRNALPQSNDGIGLLFAGNGTTQTFDAGTPVLSSSFFPSADDAFHHIRIDIFDALDGDPFDGVGDASIRAYADGETTPFLDYERGGAFTDNFITFFGLGEGAGGDGVVRHAVDNLELSILTPVPEPTTLAYLAAAIGLVALGVFRRFANA